MNSISEPLSTLEDLVGSSPRPGSVVTLAAMSPGIQCNGTAATSARHRHRDHRSGEDYSSTTDLGTYFRKVILVCLYNFIFNIFNYLNIILFYLVQVN